MSVFAHAPMFTCPCLCVGMCSCVQMPTKARGVRSPELELQTVKPNDVGARNGTPVFWKSRVLLTPQAISPASGHISKVVVDK